MNLNNPTQTLLYGLPGVGKSTLAATYPTPQLICLFDGFGKSRPYWAGHRVVHCKPQQENMVNVNGRATIIDTYDVYNQDKHISRILHFAEPDADRPQAYHQFIHVRGTLPQRLAAIGASTLIIDSLTLFHKYTRNAARKIVGGADERHHGLWYTQEIDTLAQYLVAGHLNCVLIAHVMQVESDDIEVQGALPHYPDAPGRMKRHLLAMFGDAYYCYAETKGGEPAYKVLTRTNGTFPANNTVNASIVCANTYADIYRNAPTTTIEEET
jgi:hypothetical protein